MRSFSTSSSTAPVGYEIESSVSPRGDYDDADEVAPGGRLIVGLSHNKRHRYRNPLCICFKDSHREDDSQRTCKRWMVFTALGVLIVSTFAIFYAIQESSEPLLSVSNKHGFTQTTVLLVSLDGFRHDYFTIAQTPNLDRLKEKGFFAKKTVPVFPSKTFPNHYTMVTGLYAEAHGIVSNYFYDPQHHQTFHIRDSNGWWGGEPVWVTAKLQGSKSAAYFWPGSEALIEDQLPNYYEHFDVSIPWESRAETVLEWLRSNSSVQPQVVAMYFEEPDSSGHRFGASSTEVITKIEVLDSLIGDMLEKINDIPGAREHFHIIVTTDHGMANVTDFIYVDDFINVSSDQFFIQEYYPLLQIWPANISNLEDPILDELFANLSTASPNMTCYLRRQEIPERFHYTHNDRIAPLLCLTDEHFEARTHDEGGTMIGNHGYDNELEDMAGFFVGAGKKFRHSEIDTMPDVDVYNIICSILSLTPSPNNGTSNLQTYLRIK